MSDLEAIQQRLATIVNTRNLRDSGAPESSPCAGGCGSTTGKVVDGTVNGEEAWFVPMCSACHEQRKAV